MFKQLRNKVYILYFVSKLDATNLLVAVFKQGISIHQKKFICRGDASGKPMLYIQQVQQKSFIKNKELTG